MALMLVCRPVNGMTVYGYDQSEDSYKQALALVDKYPAMKLIMAPTSVGIVAAAKALQDENLCNNKDNIDTAK